MQIRLFDFLNTYPYQRALEAGGLPYELFSDPRCLWEVCQASPCEAALLPYGAVKPLHTGLTRWGIASRGQVKSVLLIGEMPPSSWKRLVIDRRSLSSARIVRHLMEKKALPLWTLLSENNEALDTSTGRLVIGDTALSLREKYPYALDVGEIAYKQLNRGTVYAIWWMSARVRGLLVRIWRRYLPQRWRWVEEAAQRYGFSPERVRAYWKTLHYRLPPIGRAYWRRVFNQEEEKAKPSAASEGDESLLLLS
ncbi:MAG: MqnA/MqnD/SBP family protein [Bacteroidia bacterium]|nr:hypothetical protein [Bacteroidia bacterium]MDW8014512.1 MqnA/MqnD/SBP family protein [Bacteroidia bacterium]